MVMQMVIVLVALALALIGLSVRGRLGDRVPRCRHCRYDLSTTPSDGVCPECGRSLRRRRSFRLGVRRPRWLLIGAGALLMVFAMGLAGAIELERRGVIAWNADKPFAMLLLEARRAGEVRAGLAGDDAPPSSGGP